MCRTEAACISRAQISPSSKISPRPRDGFRFLFPSFANATSAAPSSSLISRVFSSLSLSSPNGAKTSGRPRIFVGPAKPAPLTLRAPPLTVAFARRNKKKSSSLTARKETSSSKFKKTQPEDDDIDEDASEALFSQLEEDLKNDLSDDDGDDEITEEDLAKFEQDLEKALGDVDCDELPGGLPLNSDSTGDDDEPDEEERAPKLKNWQVKRLAYALKIGWRKTSIKSLAAELGLDRDFVTAL